MVRRRGSCTRTTAPVLLLMVLLLGRVLVGAGGGTDRGEGEGLSLEDPDEDGGEDEGEEAVGEDEAVRVGEVLPVPVFWVCRWGVVVSTSR